MNIPRGQTYHSHCRNKISYFSCLYLLYCIYFLNYQSMIFTVVQGNVSTVVPYRTTTETTCLCIQSTVSLPPFQPLLDMRWILQELLWTTYPLRRGCRLQATIRAKIVDEHVRTRAHTLITPEYRKAHMSFFIDEHVSARYARAYTTHRIR
jgi:hypothetical protein